MIGYLIIGQQIIGHRIIGHRIIGHITEQHITYLRKTWRLTSSYLLLPTYFACVGGKSEVSTASVLGILRGPFLLPMKEVVSTSSVQRKPRGEKLQLKISIHIAFLSLLIWKKKKFSPHLNFTMRHNFGKHLYNLTYIIFYNHYNSWSHNNDNLKG